MNSTLKLVVCSVILAAVPAVASALTITDTADVQFTSDLQPNAPIVLDSFDSTLGTLANVQIELWHSGSVAIKADNDDQYNSADVQARMIRIWNLTGPDLIAGAAKTITSPSVFLGLEDLVTPDGVIVDDAAPDGHNFGTLSYTDVATGTYAPTNIALYETAGPGSVNLIVDPTQMVNDLQWVTTAPDAWQMEVQNPLLTVTAKVTYTYTPEPATIAVMGLGSLLLRRRRRTA